MNIDKIPEFAKKYWSCCGSKGVDVVMHHKNEGNFLEKLFWKNHCGVPVIKVDVKVIDTNPSCCCDNCRNEGTWQDMWVCSSGNCTYADHPSGYAGSM